MCVGEADGVVRFKREGPEVILLTRVAAQADSEVESYRYNSSLEFIR
jgi:hypothetical protein